MHYFCTVIMQHNSWVLRVSVGGWKL